MTQQIINIGSAELQGDGESIRSAFNKVNSNFTEIYGTSYTGNISFTGTVMYSSAGLQINNQGDATGATAFVIIPPDAGANVGIQNNYGTVTITSGANPGSLKTWTFTTSGSLTAPGHIIPTNNLSYDLGSPDKQWRSLYVGTGTIYIGGVPITVNTLTNTLVVGTSSYASSTLTNLATESYVIDYVAQHGGGNPFDQSLNTTSSVTFNSVGAATVNVSQINGTNPGNELVVQANGYNWIFGTDGDLTHPDGTTSTGSTVYVPYATSSSYKITTEVDMGLSYLPQTFEVIGDRIKLPNGNGLIQSGNLVDAWSLDSSNKSFTFPNQSDIEYGDGTYLSTGSLRVRVDFGGEFSIFLGEPNKTWTFNTSGDLTLPGKIIGYDPGEFEDESIKLQPSPVVQENFLFYVDQTAGTFNRAGMELPSGDVDKAVLLGFPHNNSTVGYIFNQGTDTVSGTALNNALNIMMNSGDVKITALSAGPTYTSWTFKQNGDLTLPNNSQIRVDGDNVEVGGMTNFNVEALGVVNVYTNDGAHQWQFGDDGTTTFPSGGGIIFDSSATSTITGISSVIFADSTEQTTAWVAGGSSSLATTFISVNDFPNASFINSSSVSLNYSAYSGGPSFDFTIACQSPLTENIGIDVGAVKTPYILSTGTVELKTNLGASTSTWIFDTIGGLQFPDNTVQSTAFKIGTVPVTSTSTGEVNTIAFNENYLYVCTATNSWQRIGWDVTPW